jgi:hypothetical protein
MQACVFILLSCLILTITAPSNSFGADQQRGVNAARYYVDHAPVYYHAIFGRWPATWSEVKQSGLFQNELISYAGNKIDPDDRKLDGLYDIVYSYSTRSNQPPSVHEYFEAAGRPERVTSLCAAIQPLAELVGNSDYRQLANNRDAQVHLALASMLNMSIMFFETKHDRYPATWDELLQSGLAPLGTGSSSALTGKKFQGSGAAGDFAFKVIRDDEGNSTGAFVTWVDTSGTPVRIFF